MILGIILFLYGANTYNDLVGWFGAFLFLGGLLAIIALYIYNWYSAPKKQPEPQQPTEAQNP
jgi:hypothetical protein